MGKAIVRVTSGNKPLSKRRARQPPTTTSSRRNKSIENSNYEFFPVLPRLSFNHREQGRGNETVEVARENTEPKCSYRSKDLGLMVLNPREAAEIDDPGNPIGNSVNFCVDNIFSINTATIDISTLLQSCYRIDVGDVMVNFFLCDYSGGASPKTVKSKGPPAINTMRADENDRLDALALSCNKKEKAGWKKTLKTIQGKNLLRSMSMKRWPAHGDCENRLEVAISSDSDDTIFSNLEDPEKWDIKTSSKSKTINTRKAHSKSLASPATKEECDKKYDFFHEDTDKSLDTFDSFWNYSMFTWNEEVCAENEVHRNDGENKKVTCKDGTQNPNPIAANHGAREDNESQEQENGVKFGLETTRDESNVRHRKWKNITSWKKFEPFRVSSKFNNATGKDSTPSSGQKLGTNPIQKGSYSEREDISGQALENPENSVDKMDVIERSNHQNKNETQDQGSTKFALDDARSKSLVSQRTVRNLRKRRLQKALGLTRSNRSISSMSKPKRPSWKKMLMVSIPSTRRISSREVAIPADIIHVIDKSQEVHEVKEEDIPTPGPIISEETTDKSGFNEETTDKSGFSEETTDKSKDTLDYSESDDDSKSDNEDSTSPTSNRSNVITMADLSSTSVMGLQHWAWNMGGNKNCDSDEKVNLAVSTLKEVDDKASSSIGTKDNHDAWIMNEDQLDSFAEDDDKEDENTNEGKEQRDVEGDTHDLINIETNSPKSNLESETDVTKDNTSPPQAQDNRIASPKREHFLAAQKALSKSFRKSLSSIKKKKPHSSADIASNVLVNATVTMDETPDPPIETVLMNSAVEDRNPSSTNTRIPKRFGANRANKRNSLANSGVAFSKARKFWREKTQEKTRKPTGIGRNDTVRTRDVETVHKSSDDSHSSKDVLTIENNTIAETIISSHYDPVISPSRENSFLDDIRDIAMHGLLGAEYDDYDADSLGTTNTSFSWVRDDDETVESLRDDGSLHNQSHQVIRE
ncbi:unnamed protein product [Pseudo-nitzschia multistriata]|uniref:Uncharacterized protein n=1 Tax=Pseudo-nitzschia multistriata TaxID=183589 RepID=A0A448ZSZ9_9STRA|nr:unnamed protein product [Pseudo-nitzschia multistriata]